ncbi:lectin subunit alpha [Stomoxys calcitrans]|nr:lectin subunit alpha [Stomoxys calcitrans]
MKRTGVLFTAVVTILVLPSARAGEFSSSDEGDIFYIQSEHAFNWQQAKQECNKRNMALVTINSEIKKLLVQKIINSLNLTDHLGFWMGAHRNEAGDNFEWISRNEAFHYTNWQKGEPNNAVNSEHCGMFYADTTNWNDFVCSRLLGFVCEENALAEQNTEEVSALTKYQRENTELPSMLENELRSLFKSFAILRQKWEYSHAFTKTEEISKFKNSLRELIKELSDISDEYNPDEIKVQTKSSMILEMELQKYQKELKELKETTDKRLRKTQNDLDCLSRLHKILRTRFNEKSNELENLKSVHDQQMKEQQKKLDLLKETSVKQLQVIREQQEKLNASITSSCQLESDKLLNEINEELIIVQRKQNQLLAALQKNKIVQTPFSPSESSSAEHISPPSTSSPFETNTLKNNEQKLKVVKKLNGMIGNPLYTFFYEAL